MAKRATVETEDAPADTIDYATTADNRVVVGMLINLSAETLLAYADILADVKAVADNSAIHQNTRNVAIHLLHVYHKAVTAVRQFDVLETVDGA